MKIIWTKCVKNLDFTENFVRYFFGDEIRSVTKTMNQIFFKVSINNKKAFQWDAYHLLAPAIHTSIATRYKHRGGGDLKWASLNRSPDATNRGSLYSEVPCLEGALGGLCIVRSNASWVMVIPTLKRMTDRHLWNNNKVEMFIGILFPRWSHECEIPSTDFWPL